MKIVKSLLLAGASVLALTSHAFAEPISTALSFIFSAGWWGGSLSISPILAAGLSVAASVASALLSNRNSSTTDPGEYKNTFQTSETSEVNAIGRVRLGGLQIFGNTAGSNRYRLIGHCKGEMLAIEDYRLGGREVIVESNGTVSSPPYAYPGASYVWVLSKTGTGAETAWPQLISEFPSLWTADHRVRGIAQSLVLYVSPGIYTEKFGKMYQSGEPALTVTARVTRVYDPRNPAHVRSNPATWTWSDNGILCAARIMLSYPDLTVNSFDWDFIADEADRADALVATLTGTEKRSRCWGVWLSEDARGDTMQQVLDSIGGEVVQSDEGLIRIRLIDDAPTSEITFTANHINDFTWKAGPDAVERPNVCRVQYYSPERGYEMSDITLYSRDDLGVFSGPEWAYIEDEVDRYGEKAMDIELPFCPSASQAQRIARRMFALARADQGTIRTNMAGIAAWGMSYATIEDFDCEEMMLCKIASPRIDDEAGEVEIPYVVWPTLPAWNPATMEAAAPDVVPDLEYESELDTPAAPSAFAVVQYPDTTYETRCKFAGVTGGTVAEAIYRSYSGENPNPWNSMAEYAAIAVYDSGYYAYSAVNTVGQHLEFKCRFFNAEDEGSYFSNVLNIPTAAIDNTAPAAPTLQVTRVGDDANITVISFAINVVRVQIERRFKAGSGAWGIWEILSDFQTARPSVQGQSTLTIGASTSYDIFVEIRASALTSNGTRGAYSTFAYTVIELPSD